MTAQQTHGASAPSRFYALATRAEAATTAAELGFVACNETRLLVDYRQAALGSLSSARGPKLAAHSGLADPDPNTPSALWLTAVARRVAERFASLPQGTRVLPL